MIIKYVEIIIIYLFSVFDKDSQKRLWILERFWIWNDVSVPLRLPPHRYGPNVLPWGLQNAESASLQNAESAFTWLFLSVTMCNFYKQDLLLF